MQTTLVCYDPSHCRPITLGLYQHPTASAWRGYGNPEGAYVLQQAIDMAAEKTGWTVESGLKNARGSASQYVGARQAD